MSFIVKQKIKGKIYLYKAVSIWDKDKKRSYQKRKYIGRDPDDKKSKLLFFSGDIITKNFGNIFFLEYLSKSIGLKDILKTIFPDNYKEILWLAYFDICAALPSYMFHYWQEEHDYSGVRKLTSSTVSQLHEFVGKNNSNRVEFINRWIAHIQPTEAIYYDVTSISSYSQGIEAVEWGYNRDKEALAQINLGVVFSKKLSLPIYYYPYSGSITDVVTLKNCLEYLKIAELDDVMFVLDRGFFSKTNIAAMNDKKFGFKFIQPVPMSVKAAKELLYKFRKELKDVNNAFMYNDELWYYCSTTFDYHGYKLYAHIYYNNKLATEQKQSFTIELLKIEAIIKKQFFVSQKDFIQYKKTEIPKKYRDFFKWNRKLQTVEKDAIKIKRLITKFGCFILSSNQSNLQKTQVLDNYRQKDTVEKMFDIVKNELDGDRLRTHNDNTTAGKLFVRFIALILYAEISRTMKKTNLFKKFSVKELIAELKKLKQTKIKGEKTIFSELSKSQKIIFKAFKIKTDIFS